MLAVCPLSQGVELNLRRYGSVDSAGRLPGRASLMGQDLVDEIWLGNCRDNAQPTTVLGTQFRYRALPGNPERLLKKLR